MVDLLQEMTDVDTLTESEDGANVLLDSMVSVCASVDDENAEHRMLLYFSRKVTICAPLLGSIGAFVRRVSLYPW